MDHDLTKAIDIAKHQILMLFESVTTDKFCDFESIDYPTIVLKNCYP